MKLDSVGDIVAIRELSLKGESGVSESVQILIGKPGPFPDSTGYYGPFQIVGLGSVEIHYAAGIDAIQALQLVMPMIGITLRFLNHKVGEGLRWEGGEESDFGFPETSNS